MSNFLDKLTKRNTTNNANKSGSKISGVDNNKRKISKICKFLKASSNEYQPKGTVDFIINSYQESDRILYSEITNHIYSLNDTEQTTFIVNMDALLSYALSDESEIPLYCQKIIMKIYDHSQLAIYQKANMQEIFMRSIDSTTEDMKKDIKSMEKEYITILGIFASIVLAFVGNFIFSSSVLQNITQTNIYHLLLTIDLLGFFFVTIILVLVRFILRINNEYIPVLKFRNIVIICAAIAGAILLGWLFQVDRIPEWIVTWLPWGK